MSYTAGENNILARIRAHADYSAANTDANDWDLLDSGHDDNYAILRPGPDNNEIEFISPTVYVVTWVTTIECWRRYLDDGTTAAALFGDVNKIIAQMQPYKDLGLSYVEVARIVSITTPSFRWNKDGGPAWMVQEANLAWLEEVEVTYV